LLITKTSLEVVYVHMFCCYMFKSVQLY